MLWLESLYSDQTAAPSPFIASMIPSRDIIIPGIPAWKNLCCLSCSLPLICHIFTESRQKQLHPSSPVPWRQEHDPVLRVSVGLAVFDPGATWWGCCVMLLLLGCCEPFCPERSGPLQSTNAVAQPAQQRRSKCMCARVCVSVCARVWAWQLQAVGGCSTPTGPARACRPIAMPIFISIRRFWESVKQQPPTCSHTSVGGHNYQSGADNGWSLCGSSSNAERVLRGNFRLISDTCIYLHMITTDTKSNTCKNKRSGMQTPSVVRACTHTQTWETKKLLALTISYQDRCI